MFLTVYNTDLWAEIYQSWGLDKQKPEQVERKYLLSCTYIGGYKTVPTSQRWEFHFPVNQTGILSPKQTKTSSETLGNQKLEISAIPNH